MTVVTYNNADLWDQWQNSCCSRICIGAGQEGVIFLQGNVKEVHCGIATVIGGGLMLLTSAGALLPTGMALT